MALTSPDAEGGCAWPSQAPSMHFNYRYFETEPWNGMESQWWWGGGQDTTPAYIEKDDLKFFHGSLKVLQADF